MRAGTNIFARARPTASLDKQIAASEARLAALNKGAQDTIAATSEAGAKAGLRCCGA
jgi:hypothetical protein